MTESEFISWLTNIAEESKKEGNYLFYNHHIIENPIWKFDSQITLTMGFMTFILYDEIWVFDPEDCEDLKTRLKVLTDSDTTRNEDKSKVEAMIIETLQPYREELTRKQIQIIADSIVRKIYERA